MKILVIAALCSTFAATVIAGPFGFANTGSGQFGLLDLSNGSFSAIGSFNTALIGMGESGGVLYGLDSSGNLVSIDPNTAATAQLGNIGIANVTTFTSLTTGALFAVDNSWMLWSINPRTVTATPVGTINVGNTPLPPRNSLGYADSLTGSGSSLYFTLGLWLTTPGDILSDTLYQVDPATAAATVIGTTNQEDIAGSALIGGTLYAFTGSFAPQPHKIVTLDPTNGAATFQADVAPGIASLYGAVDTTSATTSTPEPGTISLAGLAFAMLWGIRRRSPNRID